MLSPISSQISRLIGIVFFQKVERSGTEAEAGA